jgi:hypothetical protein
MDELLWYEKINQNEFEERVIESLKVANLVSTIKAVHIYDDLLKNVNIRNEQCKIGEGLYSMRYYIINKLKDMGIELTNA